MLTKEQKMMRIIEFCGSIEKCSADCILNDLCQSYAHNFLDRDESELDEMLNIIAPNVLESERPMWISAAYPPENWHTDDEGKTRINYLVVLYDHSVDIGNYVKPANTWFVCGLPAKVTHWMPMPEPPEEW